MPDDLPPDLPLPGEFGPEFARDPVVRVDPELAPLIPLALESLRGDARRMAAYLTAGELGPLRRLGHNLKGTAPGYGFMELGRLGACIQGLAQAGLSGWPDTSELERLVGLLQDYLDRVRVTF